MSDNRSDNAPEWSNTPPATYAYRGPEPDCRTCKRYRMLGGPWCDIQKTCAGGDHYQALPPVKLWRTNAAPPST